ncbi:hypothetical protein ACFC1R_17095 [Kitasatospora sp. NPDC056138]|uniref:recombination directionality factor n=1 Tax=Kitasatospora sp. NPDC056138 TaxID=3345724 RepID=UPI0035E2F221
MLEGVHMGMRTFADDTVGRFLMGKSVDNMPMALSRWRISTNNPGTAETVARLFGGTPEEIENDAEKVISIDTDRAAMPVVLDGLSAVYGDWKLWNRSKLVHHCDGAKFLSPENKVGQPCGCPPLLAERRQAAKDFRGPSPSITIRFRLADDYELGVFKFQTGMWAMEEQLPNIKKLLENIDGDALCSLEMERVDFVTKKGRNVCYYKPVLRVLGPAQN